MPNYTFTSSNCYALSTHVVSFTSTTITIKLSSTGQTVYEKDFSGGLAIMCQKNSLCVGTLSDNGTFDKTIDFANKKAKIRLVERQDKNKLISSDNEENPGIYNKYNLNQCPVRLTSANGVVTIACPCESSSGPCGNNCYTYG